MSNKRNAFEAMNAMSAADGDISSSNQFVRGNRTTRGDEITIGCSTGHLEKIASGKYIVCLLVINAEEFAKYKEGTEGA